MPLSIEKAGQEKSRTPGESRYGRLASNFVGQDAREGKEVCRLGHEPAMQLTEWLSYTHDDPTILVPGMAITLQPGLSIAPGTSMVHEDNLVIREHGAELHAGQPRNSQCSLKNRQAGRGVAYGGWAGALFLFTPTIPICPKEQPDAGPAQTAGPASVA